MFSTDLSETPKHSILREHVQRALVVPRLQLEKQEQAHFVCTKNKEI